MKKVLIALAALAVVGTAGAQTAFTVNGQLVTPAAQKQLMEFLNNQGVKDEAQQLAMARNTLITQAIINQEANRLKLPSELDVKIALDNARANILSNQLISRHLKENPVTDEEVQKTYDDAKANFKPEEVEFQLALFKTEQEARDAIARIKAGTPFAEIAKDSLDKASAENGGTIGPVPVSRLTIPGMEDALLSLDIGQVRPIPFKSPEGFFVLKLLNLQMKTFPKFEDVKEDMRRETTNQKANLYLQSLLKQAKFEEVPATPGKKAGR